jgi:hypothetical protein
MYLLFICSVRGSFCFFLVLMLYYTKSVFSYLFKHSIRFTKRKRHCIFFQSREDPLSVTEHDLWRLRHYTSLPIPLTVNFSDFLFNECHCCKISIIKKSVCLDIFYLLLHLYLFRTKITISFILLSAWKSDQSLEICTTNDCILDDEWLDLLGGVFDKWIHQLLVSVVLQNEIYICY